MERENLIETTHRLLNEADTSERLMKQIDKKLDQIEKKIDRLMDRVFKGN